MINPYPSQRLDGKFVMPKQISTLLIALALFLMAVPAQLSAQTNTLDNLGLTATTPGAGAYSLRLLSNAYTGPVVRIRIVNNYFDVYPDATSKRFSVNSRISNSYSSATAASTGVTSDILANWIGSNNATIAIWYDQSGNGYNAIQTNTASQPQIINGGTINTLNGLPTIKFSGSEWLIVTTTAFNGDLSGSIVYNASSSNASANSPQAWFTMNGILGSEQPNAVNDFGYGIFNGKFAAGNGSNDNSLASTVNVNDATTRISSWTRNSASGAIALFNMMQTNTSGTLNAGTRTAVSSVAIGSIATFGGGQFYGSLSEMILTPSVYTSAVRKAVEGNQATYFSVALPATATNSTLSALSLSAGTLNTTFASGTTSYTAAVSVGTTAITVTPTTTISVDPTVEVSVNGGAYANVNSGTASASLPLNPGDNTVDIKVTAANGINSQIYTVTVNRPVDAQTITFNAPATRSYGDGDFPAGAVASSGLTVTYASDNTAVATIVNGNIHIVGVGTANITASQAGNANYSAAADVVQSLTVNKGQITVTANAATKIYGDADPTLTYTITSGALASGDTFSGSLTRDAGVNVGTYAITQNTLALSSNYTLTFISADLIISKRPLTIKPTPQTKIYGNNEPLSYTYNFVGTSLATGDAMTGVFERATGEVPGTYALSIGTKRPVNASNGTDQANNYDITFIPEYLTITKRAITLHPVPATKVYGSADPTFPYQITAGSVAPNEGMTGTFGRQPGEDVGTYALTLGTKRPVNIYTGVSTDQYYTISFISDNLTITQNPNNSITFNALTKNYGDTDFSPATASSSTPVTYSSDNTSVATIIGNNIHLVGVGTANITASNAGDSNWGVAPNVVQSLTVNKGTAIVTAAPQTKIYGNADPVFTYTATGIVNGDVPTGALSRTSPADNKTIGDYAITQGTLSYGDKYDITFISANLTITKRPITLQPQPATKVYGNGDPTYPYRFVAGSVAPGDGMTGQFGRAPGEAVGTYALTLGAKKPIDLNGGVFADQNYDISFISSDLTITPKPINVTANAQTKVEGTPDPVFTYTSGLINGDVMTGALTRDAGETPGTYAITQGTLANSNYTITFTPGVLTITGRPMVSYSGGPYSFQLGDAISAIVPGATNVAAFGYSSTKQVIGSGLQYPQAAAVDTAGTVYATAAYTTDIYKFNTDGSIGTLSTGLPGSLAKVATDQLGNVYAWVPNSATVLKYAYGSSSPVTVNMQGVTSVYAMAFDAANNMYVSNPADNKVYKLPLSGGALVQLPGTYPAPYGIAVDGNNNVYVSTSLAHKVLKIPGGTGTAVQVGTGFNLPIGLYADASGNVFVIDRGNNTIKMIPVTNQATTVNIATGIQYMWSVAADVKGSLYVSDELSTGVSKFQPTGGYFLNRLLPAGLTFDNQTGVISGTPTQTSRATSYQVTAYKGSEKVTANIIIGVPSTDATLNNLTLSAGTLSPAFDKDSLSYTAQVDSKTGSIKLTPTAADTAATISINGNPVASGAASGELALATGDNTITVDVLAEDGISSKTYTVTVNRGLSANANLRLSLYPAEELIRYNGGPANLNYKASVSRSTTYVQLYATAQEVGTGVTVNGMTYYPGDTPGQVYLDNDTTYIQATGIAANGAARTYSVMITKTGSYNAAAQFKINTKTRLTKATSGPAMVNYTTTVSNATGTIQVYPISENSGAVVKVAGKVVPYGTPSGNLPLNAGGPTVIPITVTSENGGKTITYSITVSKTASDNANADFALNNNSILLPAGPDTYIASVATGATTVKITPKTKDPNATLTINGLAAANNTASAAITLSGDTTLIPVVVTAEDGITVKTYSIAIARNGSNNSLAKITLSNKAALLPYFGSGDKNYIALLSPGLSTVGVIVTPQDPNAKVYINGVLSAAKTPVPVSLVPYDGTFVDVEVHAEDNTTVTTYSLVLGSIGSGDYNAKFKLSPKATLVTVPNESCSCGGAAATYTTSVAAETQYISVTTLARDSAATIYVNGLATAGGVPSAQIALNDDSTTTITIEVVSEVGIPKTYYIIVSKTGSNYAGASFALLPGSQLVQTKTGTAKVNYTTTVDAAQTTLKIIPKAATPGSTITIDGNLVAAGDTATVALNGSGITMVNALVTAQDGITTKTYSIAISKNGSNNALAKLKINTGTQLNKTTGSGYQNYITSVPAATTAIGITPVTEDANATLTMNGDPVTANAQSLQPLAADSTHFTLVVTAQDGITIKTYNLTVVRNGSNVATATFALNTTSKVNKAASGPAQFNFSTSVSPAVSALVVTPKLTDANATVTINGVPATDGMPTDPIALEPSGSTLISMLVTAEDGVSTRSYSILIAKDGSNNADLALSLSPKATLTKVAGPAAGNYQASIDAGLSTIKVKTKAAATGTTITINGAPASTATSGTPVALTGDTTMVNITSVAEDGISTKVYTIALIKSAPLTMFATVTTNKNDVIANASTKLLSPVTEVSPATKGVTVYPNPFIDELKIDLKGYNAREARVIITTLQARELFNKTLPVTDNKVELNVSNLKQGIYIINITVNGERKGYRIVKN